MEKPIEITNEEILSRLENVITDPSDVPALLELIMDYFNKYQAMACDFTEQKRAGAGNLLAYTIGRDISGLIALQGRCIEALEEMKRESDVLFRLYYKNQSNEQNGDAEQKTTSSTDQQPISEIQH